MRNNWLTEKCQEVKFQLARDSQPQVARWDDLKQLYSLEKGSIITLTKLRKLYILNQLKGRMSLFLKSFS